MQRSSIKKCKLEFLTNGLPTKRENSIPAALGSWSVRDGWACQGGNPIQEGLGRLLSGSDVEENEFRTCRKSLRMSSALKVAE
jgi:hypothetical protein